jgi:hypothetical protein
VTGTLSQMQQKLGMEAHAEIWRGRVVNTVMSIRVLSKENDLLTRWATVSF